MHFVCLIRAIKEDLDHFITDMQAQYWPYIVKDTLGKEQTTFAQTGVRPWGGMYEFVFPEAEYDNFMATIGRLDTVNSLMHSAAILILREALGLEKVKPVKEGTPGRLTWRVSHPDIRLYPIGIKKDGNGIVPNGKGGAFIGEQL